MAVQLQQQQNTTKKSKHWQYSFDSAEIPKIDNIFPDEERLWTPLQGQKEKAVKCWNGINKESVLKRELQAMAILNCTCKL